MMRLAALAGLLVVAQPAAAFDPFTAVGIDRRPDAVVPLAAPLRDADGRPTDLAQLGHGRPIVLVPVQHRCPNICGVTLAGLGRAVAAQRFVAGRDFTLVVFGIDPAEGPDAARQSLATLRQTAPALPAGGVAAVTGPAASVTAVTAALGYRYAWDDRRGQYAHLAATAVLTADGRLARWLYGVAPAPEDLTLALTEAGEGRLGGWAEQMLLLCYHYDPETGRYGSIITTALRLAGGLTAMLVGGLIGWALWRERRAGRRGTAP